MRDGATLSVSLPDPVRRALERLASDRAEAVLVGGCVRDLVRGVRAVDWDVATAAPPERVAGLFPGSTWQNRFGTVTVRDTDAGGTAMNVEITTYRVEGSYRDRRRPDEVRWGTSLHEDLARRDFTVNAMAWRPLDLAAGHGTLVDPFGGAADLEAGVLRAVGDPAERIAEDALRIVRAVRFATRLGLTLDPATEEAIRRHAASAASLSGERVRDELLRILAGDVPPSRAFLLAERLQLLNVLLPELAALRGVPQAKALPGDALDHSLRTADALPAGDPVLCLAGLLHDLGKATTLADGHFIGHDREGAALADRLMRRLRLPRTDATRIKRLVRHHMFGYTPDWTDAAVRRFVRRVGIDLLDDLFALRAADNAASGATEPEAGGLDELRARSRRVVAEDAIEAGQLAVDGHDLVAELEIEPGPLIGTLLSRLLDAVLEDPTVNQRDRLLRLARGWLAQADGDAAHRDTGAGRGTSV
jgi:poly(A) polymerase/tRNA nucleotidyltransferase (CCA-adding enzyme)